MQTEARRASALASTARLEAAGVSLGAQRTLLTWALVLTDGVALLCAFAVAYWVRFVLQVTLAPEVMPDVSVYRGLSALLIPFWLVVFVLYNLYDRHARLGGTQESSKAFNACTTATMLVIVGTFVLPQFVVSRMWLITVWLLSFLFVAAGRFGARRVIYALRARGFLLSGAVIVGTNREAVSLAGFLQDQRSSGVEVCGFVATGHADQWQPDAAPVLGHIGDLQEIVERYGIEEVIVAITALNRRQLLRLCEGVEPLPVHLRLSSGLFELLTARVEMRTVGTVPLMSVHKVRLERVEVAVKTLLDTTIASICLLVLSPLLLAIAAWVAFDSPGPIFHRRRVLGVSGRRFDAFKFRTMHVNGDALLAADPAALEELRTNHKLRHDPRITRSGHWLRRYSLDEVPQLINVLRGEMSLVGPRMITAEELSKYGDQRVNLLTVKPGITGLWQVSGRSDLSYDERVRMDMYYVRNYSVWMDLQILFVHTLPAVIKGRGAY